MDKKKKDFKDDIFEEDEQAIIKNSFFGIEITEEFTSKHFNEKQIKDIKLLDSEYKVITNNIGEIRRKLSAHNKRIQLACTIKLFAAATITDKNIQDEMVEIGEKCPIIMSFFKDNNTFFRSFIVQFLFKLIFNEKDEKDCNKGIFKFIKRISELKYNECKYPIEFYNFKDSELKCYLSSFILSLYIFKLLNQITNLEKVFKLYNDHPEVDAAAIIICKNMLGNKFQSLMTHEMYKFLIDENQIRIVPQILAQYDEDVNQTIIGLFVEIFNQQLMQKKVMNDERAECPQYFVPQTKKAIHEDIYIYKSYENQYYSIFDKYYSQKYLDFCVSQGFLYQQDQRELLEKLKNANEKILTDFDEQTNTGAKEQKKWMDRVQQMDQKNKELKQKQDDYFPHLKCCECERELSDTSPLLKFDVYYFCEACILDMISHLNREDKQFTYIGQTQVKRYQLRDAITELNNERERLQTLKLTEQQKKKNKNKGQIGYKETQDLMQSHINKKNSEKTEKKWEDLLKICVRCSDDLCYKEELYLLKEVKTLREVAVCMSCLVYLDEQVKYTYRNVQLHKTFELSNEDIKQTFKDFAREHLEKTKQVCVKCKKIRLNNFIIQPQTKAKELSMICKQCFIEIFANDEKLEFFKVSEQLKEHILDQLFIQDYSQNICVSCDKQGLKTLTIENVSNFLPSQRINNILKNKSNKSSRRNSKEEGHFPKFKMDLNDEDNKKIQKPENEQKENQNKDNQESDKEEDDQCEKRLSKICIDCVFLNIGKCKNPFMDYLITYKKLRTNIVFKYNNQIKTLLENDARRKMQDMLMTCAMCLRKLKDLHKMNDKDQRICTSCFFQYRVQFRLNNGEYDGYKCDLTHQQTIFIEVLAYLVDTMQCIGCKERIKNFDYEVIKIFESYSNVVLCDNCIKDQLLNINPDGRNPYQIHSKYLNESLQLQNKREVDEKIKQFALQNKRAANFNINPNKNDEDEKRSGSSSSSDDSAKKQKKKKKKIDTTGMPPRQKQHLSSKQYNLRCFNRVCQEVEIYKKNKKELTFVKMPKCQCIFCIHCFTAFYHKLVESRFKQQKVEGGDKKMTVQERIDGDEGMIDHKKNKKVLIELEKYCPSMLCNSKYTENQIKELANGYQIELEDEEDPDIDLKKRQNKILEDELKLKYQHEKIECSVCNKEDKLLAVVNDDFFIKKRQENSKKVANMSKMNDHFIENKETEFFKEIVGLCECLHSCKPCLFETYYKDRCRRCLKKPDPHIYRILFDFKKNMKCSQCQHTKFNLLEEGPLLTRTNTRYECQNCKKKFDLN